MSADYTSTKRSARTVAKLTDQTQAGEILWSRADPTPDDPPLDPSFYLRESLRADADGSVYVLRVGIDPEGGVALSLLGQASGGETTEVASSGSATLGPYVKDLHRAVAAQRRVLSLAGAGQGAPARDLASATDLAAWADRRDAQAALPQLVRRLVTATAADLTRASFRAGEGVGLAGWDGVTEAARPSAFVPEGLSVWEMGVGEPAAKAQDDYRKRTTGVQEQDPETDGIEPGETTFVFVTPRRWSGKDDWGRRREAEGVWRSVRVLDGDDLEAWLETAPAVHAWFSALLGKDCSESESLERWWDDWSEATRPPLPPAVLLSGRDESTERLLSVLAAQGPGESVSVAADSRDEALAFVAAALTDAPRLLDRALVVRTEGAWRRLSVWPTPLVLMPVFERPQVSVPVRAGHRVVLPLGREATNAGAIELPRLRRHGIEQALREAGLPRDRASELATLGRRSLSALRRALAVDPAADRPDWAQPESARDVALAVLVGSWTDASDGDREVVSTIAGRPYDEFAQTLSRWSNTSDPPARRVGDVWMVAAKGDAWALTAHALTTRDLDRFRTAAVTVLGGDDPALDLPLEQRAGASLLGKERAHSGVLVGALADTLALMAMTDADVALVGGRRGATEAAVVVRTVLEAANEDASGRRWHAVSGALPLLAEAAPDEFLRTVEAGTRDADGPVLSLFQEDEGLLGPSSPHPSLLWALETLAWDPELLPRAARVLAALTRLAPPVKILNRPFNSLRSILVLWHNGTGASLPERVRVLDLLHRHEPEVAWPLALALIPTGSDTTSPPSSPRYRDWKPDEVGQGVRADDLDRALGEVVRRACEWAGTDGARWAALVERVASAVLPVRDVVVDGLEVLDPDGLDLDGRRALYRALRDVTNRHRRFPDARWSMPQESLERLMALVPSV